MTNEEAVQILDGMKHEKIPRAAISIHRQNEALKMAITALCNQPEWIPCEERLPEYGVSVLTYDGYCFFVEKRIPIIRDDNGDAISSDWWVSDDYDESESGYYPNLRDGACIAWMPLPEPYKGGESNG